MHSSARAEGNSCGKGAGRDEVEEKGHTSHFSKWSSVSRCLLAHFLLQAPAGFLHS